MALFHYLSTKIYFGEGEIAKLQLAKEIGNKAMLVTGRKFAIMTGLYEKANKILEEAGIEIVGFPKVPENPDTTIIEEGARVAREKNCDLLIAIGGGSAIDTAKGIAIMVTNPGRTRDYFGKEKLKNEPLPIIAVPTTAGTGSEVTRYAVIVDPESGTKKTINSFSILPKISIVDPELTKTLTKFLTAATGMDTFSHGLESFLSLNSNHMSRIFSKEAVALVMGNLLKLINDPDNSELREKMCLAALYGGIAINQTGTIIIHGMGYALTILYGLQHGAANALLMPYVLDYLLERDNFDKKIFEILKFKDVKKTILEFNRSLSLPTTLKEIGVDVNDIEKLALRGPLDCARGMKNLGIDISVNDFKKIYKSAFGGGV